MQFAHRLLNYILLFSQFYAVYSYANVLLIARSLRNSESPKISIIFLSHTFVSRHKFIRFVRAGFKCPKFMNIEVTRYFTYI